MKDEYLELKKIYTEKINKKIDSAWPFIIESFVEYYGEENRDVIKDRLEDIVFVYYVSDFLINYTIREYIANVKEIEKMTEEILKILEINELDNKSQILEFIFGKPNFFNSNLKNLKILSFDKHYEYLSTKEERELFNKENLISKEKIDKCIKYMLETLEKVRICEKNLRKIKTSVKVSGYIVDTNVYREYIEEKDTMIKNFYELASNKLIGLSTNEVLEYNILKNYIYAIILKEDNYQPIEFSLPIDDNFLVKLIGLPVFQITDGDLIHEINHAVRSSIVGKKSSNEQESIFDKYIVKNGVELNDIELFKKTEELLADISGLEIYKIFKDKYKEPIFDDNILNEEVSGNTNNILIEKFFNIYKCFINHVSIGDDLNLLFSQIGEENFRLLAEYVNLNYDNISNVENVLLELDEILKNMKDYPKKKLRKC